MMKQFEVIDTSLGRALFEVDTTCYGRFWGFRRIVKYLDALNLYQ